MVVGGGGGGEGRGEGKGGEGGAKRTPLRITGNRWGNWTADKGNRGGTRTFDREIAETTIERTEMEKEEGKSCIKVCST